MQKQKTDGNNVWHKKMSLPPFGKCLEILRGGRGGGGENLKSLSLKKKKKDTRWKFAGGLVGKKSSIGGKLDIFWSNTIIKLEEPLSKNLISNKQFSYIM